MEQFIVSARKYRPQTFKDVVGQQAITNTLLNAIETNHLAQALLFTGPRGVGKTTCARILARKTALFTRKGEIYKSIPHIFESLQEIFKKYPNIVHKKAISYLKSNKTYIIRFGINILMQFFLNDNFS